MLPALRWSRKRKLSSSLTLLNFANFSFPKSCAHSQLYSSNLQFELSFLHVHTFPWQDSFALLRLLHPLCLPHLSHLRRSFTFVLNSSSVMSTSSSTMFLNTNFMASESFLAFCLRSHCVSARTTIVASSRHWSSTIVLWQLPSMHSALAQAMFPINSFQHDLHEARALIERHGPRPIFRLPWEKGAWKRVFNLHPSPLSTISQSLPLPSSFLRQSSLEVSDNSNAFPVEIFQGESQSGYFQAEDPPHSGWLSSILPEAWNQIFHHLEVHQGCMDGLRHLAISRLIAFLADSNGSSMFWTSSDPWILHASFESALAMKATSTIIKRSMDLQRFRNWCDANQRRFTPFSENSFVELFGRNYSRLFAPPDHSLFYKL